MLTKRIEDALNQQINKEFYSAYLYLSMSAYCASIGLEGFANWMKVQYEEEVFHTMKIYNYLLDRKGKVILETIEKPDNEWINVIELFENVLKHEQFVTQSINHLMDIAIEEKDHATVSFLKWFVDEQVEEEVAAEAIIDKLKLIKGEGNGIFMIDKDLAARVFTVPADTQQ
ncbi:MAG: ferritin [Candidatus Gastranaerophilales bacterium]|nr:ferritin [Candidatus Gastranaerophilales bacterium]